MRELKAGSLPPPDEETQRFYSDALRRDDIGNLIRAGFALLWLIPCLIGGLVGGILVMRKRALQCSVCGASPTYT